MIQRRAAPEKGLWGLPGGHRESAAGKGEPWRPGAESAAECAYRELEEETGIPGVFAAQYGRFLARFEQFGRDPRDNSAAWAISDAFLIEIPDHLVLEVTPGDDAAAARWLDQDQAADNHWPFDHRQMVVASGFLPR